MLAVNPVVRMTLQKSAPDAAGIRERHEGPICAVKSLVRRPLQGGLDIRECEICSSSDLFPETHLASSFPILSSEPQQRNEREGELNVIRKKGASVFLEFKARGARGCAESDMLKHHCVTGGVVRSSPRLRERFSTISAVGGPDINPFEKDLNDIRE